MKLNARELREVDEIEVQNKLKTLKRKPIYFILENVYDTYNIGGLFRLADALAIEKLYLCGQTEIPPNHKIKKASIGTYKVVPWQYCKSAKDAIAAIKTSAVKDPPVGGGKTAEVNIVAVEQSSKSIPYTKADYSLPLVLIMGNETSGITEETLKLANQIVEIPMWGINKSLNVIVSAAIVSYWAVNVDTIAYNLS